MADLLELRRQLWIRAHRLVHALRQTETTPAPGDLDALSDALYELAALFPVVQAHASRARCAEAYGAQRAEAYGAADGGTP
jgi:hypothetical protein